MTKINICTFKSDESHRLGTRQEISAHLSLTKPTYFEHIRINEILRYCDIYKYVLREEKVGTRGGRPSACIHLLGIHHDKLRLIGFLLSQSP